MFQRKAIYIILLIVFTLIFCAETALCVFLPDRFDGTVNFEGFDPSNMQMPEGFDPANMGDMQMPEGFDPANTGDMEIPEGFDPANMGEEPWEIRYPRNNGLQSGNLL